MSTIINLTYKNTNYTLEYTRQQAAMIESQGFDINQLSSKPNVMIPMLVYGAFAKHHRGIKRKEVDEIYDNLVGKAGKDGEDSFVGTLAGMYADTINSLTEDKAEDEGNAATWEVLK